LSHQNLDSLISIKFVISVPVIILIVGFAIIKNSFHKLNACKIRFFYAEEAKNTIDETLNLYNQKYTYQIDFNKEVHGTIEVDIEIELT